MVDRRFTGADGGYVMIQGPVYLAVAVRRRAMLAVLLTGSALAAATPALAQTVPAADLERRNRDLEAENARLRAALDRAGVVAPSAEAAPAEVQAAGGATPTAVAPASDDARGDVELGHAITVTGRRLREVTRSVSAVTGEELEKFQVNNFRDIASRIGNVRTSWNNPNTASVIVRGVGWAAGAGVLDPSVGVSVDDVSHGINSISALSNYLDIETVEVLRGPTGSDGLRATNLGRVAITTRRPGFTPEARAAFTFGERNTLIGTAALRGGIIDDLLAFRLTLNRETGDGPYKNANDAHYTWRNTDRTNARAQFLLTPSPRFEALVTLDYTPTGREICENCFAFNTKTQPLYDWIDPATRQRGRVDYANDAFGKLQRRWFPAVRPPGRRRRPVRQAAGDPPQPFPRTESGIAAVTRRRRAGPDRYRPPDAVRAGRCRARPGCG